MRDDSKPDWLAPQTGLLQHAWADRDMSWLEFNRRVLHEAQDSANAVARARQVPGDLLVEPRRVLHEARRRAAWPRRGARARTIPSPRPAMRRRGSRRSAPQSSNCSSSRRRCYRELRQQLAGRHVVLAEWEELTDAQRDEAGKHFDANVSPALTPLGFDPAHPFPFISNLSTSWGFVLRVPGTDDRIPVRVKSPTELPQWVALHADVPAGERRFVSLETLIREQRRKAVPGHGDRERDAVSHPAQRGCRARAGRRDASRGGHRGTARAALPARGAHRLRARRGSGDPARAGRALRARRGGRLRSRRPARLHRPVPDRLARHPGAARSAVDAAARRRASRTRTRTSSRRSPRATSSCTTRTKASTPAWSASSRPRRAIRRPSRSR